MRLRRPPQRPGSSCFSTRPRTLASPYRARVGTTDDPMHQQVRPRFETMWAQCTLPVGARRLHPRMHLTSAASTVDAPGEDHDRFEQVVLSLPSPLNELIFPVVTFIPPRIPWRGKTNQ